MMMKSSKPIKYSFIVSDVNDEYNKNNGFCVFDTFVNTYSKHIKKLTQERFIEMCYSTIKNDFDDLDASIKWEPSQGVSPQMLFEICKILHISHYAFDVTNNCF